MQHTAEGLEATVDSAARVVFSTLDELGFDTMTNDGVEFVLCGSALTGQM